MDHKTPNPKKAPQNFSPNFWEGNPTPKTIKYDLISYKILKITAPKNGSRT